mmetsp:Transcript_5874/g.8822  ORF Transcript_5874/g.8822 Transcript_5874/m.8822 type:complete len:209 (+) Transcript_5874:242-868(+)
MVFCKASGSDRRFISSTKSFEIPSESIVSDNIFWKSSGFCNIFCTPFVYSSIPSRIRSICFWYSSGSIFSKASKLWFRSALISGVFLTSGGSCEINDSTVSLSMSFRCSGSERNSTVASRLSEIIFEISNPSSEPALNRSKMSSIEGAASPICSFWFFSFIKLSNPFSSSFSSLFRVQRFPMADTLAQRWKRTKETTMSFIFCFLNCG